MADGHLEVLVEPFKESQPGPHVRAVIETLTEAGLPVEMGPFSTTASGPLGTVVDAVHSLLTAGFEAGATSIQIRVTDVGA